MGLLPAGEAVRSLQQTSTASTHAAAAAAATAASCAPTDAIAPSHRVVRRSIIRSSNSRHAAAALGPAAAPCWSRGRSSRGGPRGGILLGGGRNCRYYGRIASEESLAHRPQCVTMCVAMGNGTLLVQCGCTWAQCGLCRCTRESRGLSVLLGPQRHVAATVAAAATAGAAAFGDGSAAELPGGNGGGGGVDMNTTGLSIAQTSTDGGASLNLNLGEDGAAREHAIALLSRLLSALPASAPPTSSSEDVANVASGSGSSEVNGVAAAGSNVETAATAAAVAAAAAAAEEAAHRLVDSLGPSGRAVLLTALFSKCTNVAETFAAADANNDGVLDPQEFAAFMEAQEAEGGRSEQPLTSEQLWQLFSRAVVGNVGFGITDNSVMIISGGFIESNLGTILGISTLTAAGLGNAVSDIIGTVCREYIESVSSLFMPELKASSQQLATKEARWAETAGASIGVTVGCLLGLTPLLFMKEREPSPEECVSVLTSTGPKGEAAAALAAAVAAGGSNSSSAGSPRSEVGGTGGSGWSDSQKQTRPPTMASAGAADTQPTVPCCDSGSQTLGRPAASAHAAVGASLLSSSSPPSTSTSPPSSSSSSSTPSPPSRFASIAVSVTAAAAPGSSSGSSSGAAAAAQATGRGAAMALLAGVGVAVAFRRMALRLQRKWSDQ